MSIQKVSTILKNAGKEGYGVTAFNCFNYESIAWLIETAEEEQTPVIVMLYPAMSKAISFSSFTAIAKDLAAKASVPVGIHLDHSNSFEQIMESIKAGFQTVMIDGSALEFEKNVRITADVVRSAHALDVDVEAELGRVGSAANLNDFTNTDNYTDVNQAVEFIERTGVDCLAVSIGSAHGNYIATPKLDIKRLEEINNATDLPLVLHGGTGIPDEQIREAVKAGINKLNIGTEYNQKFYRIIGDIIKEQKSHASIFDCLNMAKPEIKEYLRSKIRLLKV